jgi:hypothetical protein
MVFAKAARWVGWTACAVYPANPNTPVAVGQAPAWECEVVAL